MEKASENYRELDPRQRTAILKQREIAERLLAEQSDIAELYRGGRSCREIAERVIPEEVKISPRVASNAVLLALRSLLEPGEAAVLGRVHRSVSSTRVGCDSVLQGKGIHGLSPEERSANAAKSYAGGLGLQTSEELGRNGRKGGARAAETNRRNGAGIFGLTLDQRRRQGSKVGKAMREEGKGIFGRSQAQRRADTDKSLLAQGKKPFNDAEVAFLRSVLDDPVYRRVSGKARGKTDIPKVQSEMEVRFGVQRAAAELSNKLYHLRRK